jgi:hypothetical protein
MNPMMPPANDVAWQGAPSEKKIVAFGGTGKTVALIYTKIRRLLGEDANVVVCDFPPADDGSPDARLDADLRSEGIGGDSRIDTIPRIVGTSQQTLTAAFKIPQDVADALFTPRQQQTPPSLGLNQEPQVGATVTHFKIRNEGEEIVEKCLTGQQGLFFVGGLGGGTGTGVPHGIAEYLRRQPACGRLHGVFLLPWQEIGGGSTSDEGQKRNAWSLLRFLRKHASLLYDDVVIIGSPAGVRQYSALPGGGERPYHPTLILAALYIHMYEEWGAQGALVEQFRRIEIVQRRLTLDQIRGARGSLHEMLVHSRRVETLLREIINQAPDEKLAFFSLYPLSSSLAWRSIEVLLKRYRSIRDPLSYRSAWSDLKEGLGTLADQESARRRWIVRLAAEPRLFDFRAETVEDAGTTGLSDYRETLARDESYRFFQFRRPDEARSDLCQFIRDWVAEVTWRRMRGRI